MNASRISAFPPGRKFASDLPLPLTRRRLARFSKSAKGMPPPGPSAFTNTFPPSNANSSVLRFSKGEPGVPVATCKQQCDRIIRRGKDGRNDRSRGHEPPETGPERKLGIAEHDFDFLQRHACLVRGELCENRVRAGADILCAAGDARAAVVAQLHIGRGGKSRAAIHAAPAIPSRALGRRVSSNRLGIALRPAEFLRAQLEALEVMPR